MKYIFHLVMDARREINNKALPVLPTQLAKGFRSFHEHHVPGVCSGGFSPAPIPPLPPEEGG